MNNILKVSFIVLSLFVSSMSFASELTENAVKNVLTKIDTAIETLNAYEVSNTLSDNVTIVMNITMQGKKQTLKPSKQQYLAMLKEGWAVAKNYKYNRSNVIIKVNGNEAIVSAKVIESMTVQGQKISGESKEVLTIELVNGTPLITKVVGYTNM